MNNPLMLLSQMLGMGNDPQQIIQNLISQNPNVQIILNQMKTSGLSPQQYVMQYARQNNINIQPMLNMLNQKGIKL